MPFPRPRTDLRLALLLEEGTAQHRSGPDLFLGVLGDAAGAEALKLAEACRDAGVRVELTLKGTGVAKQFKRADRLKARWAGVLGEGELQSGELKLKTMATGEERVVPLAELAKTLGSGV